jgi:hypothetical protein
MTTSPCTHWAWRRCLGPPTDADAPDLADRLDSVANRWHEESKRRYEELAHEWLELAEQRQRSA